MKVAAALVGRVSRPVPDPPGPAPGWVDGRGRRGRRPQTWRSAPLPDPAPQRNFRESAEGGRTGALGSGRVGRTGSGPMAPVGRPDGAGFKPGNRKGLRLWCLGINRLQTKTETPFRFRRRSCARSTLQNAHVRAPAAGPTGILRRALIGRFFRSRRRRWATRGATCPAVADRLRGGRLSSGGAGERALRILSRVSGSRIPD
jgi:hypothetical protein